MSDNTGPFRYSDRVRRTNTSSFNGALKTAVTLRLVPELAALRWLTK
jgi:hypothetical protein